MTLNAKLQEELSKGDSGCLWIHGVQTHVDSFCRVLDSKTGMSGILHGMLIMINPSLLLMVTGHSMYEHERCFVEKLRRELRNVQVDNERQTQEAVQRCSAAWASVAARREEENANLRGQLNQVIGEKREFEAKLQQQGVCSQGNKGPVYSSCPAFWASLLGLYNKECKSSEYGGTVAN